MDGARSTGRGLRFRVLGSVEVLRDGTVVPVPQGTVRDLLAILLMAKSEVVSADGPIEAVWSDRAPANSRAALRNAMSRLRR
jgi:DNA-binding SARP family transcriptional activator